MSIEEQEEKDKVMAVGIDVRRANQLIYDQIAALGTFTGDWQKNSTSLT